MVCHTTRRNQRTITSLTRGQQANYFMCNEWQNYQWGVKERMFARYRQKALVFVLSVFRPSLTGYAQTYILLHFTSRSGRVVVLAGGQWLLLQINCCCFCRFYLLLLLFLWLIFIQAAIKYQREFGFVHFQFTLSLQKLQHKSLINVSVLVEVAMVLVMVAHEID